MKIWHCDKLLFQANFNSVRVVISFVPQLPELQEPTSHENL